MSGILSIGKSALNAAQVGLSVTGHNIANANTPGYSRQQIVQAAAQSQDYGFGYIGQGTEVAEVSRIFNQVLVDQLVNSQSASTGTDTYSVEISAINNMLSDASAGITPALNDFFASVQDLAANPSDIPTRQSMLSSSQSLVNRFQSTANRLNEIQEGVNKQLTASVGLVNVYAEKIASLNDTIEKTVNAGGNQPNDLLDQRDQLVLELSKEIKTTVVPQGQGSYNIYIGNGLPLVIGNSRITIGTERSLADPTRLEIAYRGNGGSTLLGEASLPGGAIGGLLQFRAKSLDTTQNQIGQIAIALASDFNAQHISGRDLSGAVGGNLFNVPTPTVTASSKNNTSTTAAVSSTISNTSLLTTSNYRVSYDGDGTTNSYTITRMSDGLEMLSSGTLPVTLDGLSITVSAGTKTTGDEFFITPTRNISNFSLAITDARKLAMASLATPAAPGDNTNALLLANLQNKSTINGNTTSYSAAYSQLVNSIGNKTRELKVTAAAESQVLEQNTAAVQSESGVNLDEEATNLIRYQQAYQAAGKMMQIASQLFDTLLQIGQ